MCTLIELEQNRTPAEIAFIIAWANPDLAVSEKHMKANSIRNQHRQNLARQRAENIKLEQPHDFQSVYLTESRSLTNKKGSKLTAEQYESMRKIFSASV